MLIRDILNLKGGTIHSIESSGTLAAAVEVMVRHDIGSLVVTDGGKMTGMLTFREVLQALQRGNATLAGLTVRDVMVADPVRGDPADTIERLRELMTRDHVRYLPVLDGEKLLGVVSFHDVAKAVIRETSLENRLLRRYIEADPSAEKQ